ncbi:MAG: ABC transporter ATP-binding protein [Planctomycetota bacterium]|nr:ABC transporter ATP-binding protein [Planctomycetota bacterium]
MKYFLRAMKLLWPLKGKLALFVFCTVLLGLVGTSPLAVARAIIAHLQNQNDKLFNDKFGNLLHEFFVSLFGSGEGYIWGLCLVSIGLLALKNLFDFITKYLESWIAYRLTTDAVIRLMHHLLSMDMAFYDKRKMGDIVTRVTQNTQSLGSTARLTLDFLQQPPMIVCLTAYALYLNWQLFLIALAGFALAVLPVLHLTRKIYKQATKARVGQGEISQSILEDLYGLRTVQAYEAVDAEKENFSRKCEKLFGFFMKQRRSRAMQGPLSELVLGSGIAGVLLIGSLQVMRGQMPFADFVIFQATIGMLYQPVKTMLTLVAELAEFVPQAEATFEYLDTKPAIGDAPDAVVCPRLAHEIRFENVTFDYGRGPVFSGLDLSIRKGERIGIVGRTGVGKSTLLSLMLRFYDPQKGRVTIDGVDIRKATLRSLRSQIALVTQEPFLFHASIEENIRYGKPDATKQEIVAAAKDAAIHDEIMSFPERYATPAGDRGTTVSGGQRQRIAVARAILRNAPILLLDEATSSLDSASEKLVQQALDRLAEGRTSLIVAHRLSTVRDADRIIVFGDAGEIEAVAPHDELLRISHTYRKLWERQAGVAAAAD